MRSLRLFLAVFVLHVLGACSATSWQAVPRPNPDAPVAPGFARVVVIRTFGVIGSVREVRIDDQDRTIGVLGSNGWICWDRVAQRGVGRALYEGYVVDGGPVESLFDLPREPGTTTWAVLSLNSSDRKPMAKIVSPEEGRALIADREPAEVR